MGQEIIQGAPAGMSRRIPRRIETERLTLRCPRVEDGRMLHAAILEIHCDPENKTAVALPLKLGYTLEKVLPHARRDSSSGTWHDIAIFVRMRPRKCVAPWTTG